MDGGDFGGLFEWVQGFVEDRWGKFWAWTAFIVLLALFVGGALWAMRP